ncbi:Hypothetical predicted protein [Octopus vulgaris]|uniref:Uncharacterized protein n=1 Tax=Octopus vulgaris TaxID=6645 RepID=A0AA36EVU1_OCTVU|nr:Hypothetical predicted protein [Octopus vulgaris]
MSCCVSVFYQKYHHERLNGSGYTMISINRFFPVKKKNAVTDCQCQSGTDYNLGKVKYQLPTDAICSFSKNKTMASTSLLICLFVTVFVGLLASPATAQANWVVGGGYNGGYDQPIGLTQILTSIIPYLVMRNPGEFYLDNYQ